MTRLSAFSVLGDVPSHELENLAAAASEDTIEQGTTILTDGDNGYVIYFIEEGEVEVIGDAGETVATLGPGDTFGEIALVVTGRRTATVVAKTPLRVISVFEQDFRRVMNRVPELERALRRLSGERLNPIS